MAIGRERLRDWRAWMCYWAFEAFNECIRKTKLSLATANCMNNDQLDICSHFAGDAILYSLFRYNAAPSSCPFRGPLEFTYTQGDEPKTCMSPRSQADACTQDSKLLLRYMACPDVRGTETKGQSLILDFRVLVLVWGPLVECLL